MAGEGGEAVLSLGLDKSGVSSEIQALVNETVTAVETLRSLASKSTLSDVEQVQFTDAAGVGRAANNRLGNLAAANGDTETLALSRQLGQQLKRDIDARAVRGTEEGAAFRNLINAIQRRTDRLLAAGQFEFNSSQSVVAANERAAAVTTAAAERSGAAAVNKAAADAKAATAANQAATAEQTVAATKTKQAAATEAQAAKEAAASGALVLATEEAVAAQKGATARQRQLFERAQSRVEEGSKDFGRPMTKAEEKAFPAVLTKDLGLPPEAAADLLAVHQAEIAQVAAAEAKAAATADGARQETVMSARKAQAVAEEILASTAKAQADIFSAEVTEKAAVEEAAQRKAFVQGAVDSARRAELNAKTARLDENGNPVLTASGRPALVNRYSGDDIKGIAKGLGIEELEVGRKELINRILKAEAAGGSAARAFELAASDAEKGLLGFVGATNSRSAASSKYLEGFAGRTDTPLSGQIVLDSGLDGPDRFSTVDLEGNVRQSGASLAELSRNVTAAKAEVSNYARKLKTAGDVLQQLVDRAATAQASVVTGLRQRPRTDAEAALPPALTGSEIAQAQQDYQIAVRDAARHLRQFSPEQQQRLLNNPAITGLGVGSIRDDVTGRAGLRPVIPSTPEELAAIQAQRQAAANARAEALEQRRLAGQTSQALRERLEAERAAAVAARAGRRGLERISNETLGEDALGARIGTTGAGANRLLATTADTARPLSDLSFSELRKVGADLGVKGRSFTELLGRIVQRIDEINRGIATQSAGLTKAAAAARSKTPFQDELRRRFGDPSVLPDFQQRSYTRADGSTILGPDRLETIRRQLEAEYAQRVRDFVGGGEGSQRQGVLPTNQQPRRPSLTEVELARLERISPADFGGDPRRAQQLQDAVAAYRAQATVRAAATDPTTDRRLIRAAAETLGPSDRPGNLTNDAANRRAIVESTDRTMLRLRESIESLSAGVVSADRRIRSGPAAVNADSQGIGFVTREEAARRNAERYLSSGAPAAPLLPGQQRGVGSPVNLPGRAQAIADETEAVDLRKRAAAVTRQHLRDSEDSRTKRAVINTQEDLQANIAAEQTRIDREVLKLSNTALARKAKKLGLEVATVPNPADIEGETPGKRQLADRAELERQVAAKEKANREAELRRQYAADQRRDLVYGPSPELSTAFPIDPRVSAIQNNVEKTVPVGGGAAGEELVFVEERKKQVAAAQSERASATRLATAQTQLAAAVESEVAVSIRGRSRANPANAAVDAAGFGRYTDPERAAAAQAASARLRGELVDTQAGLFGRRASDRAGDTGRVVATEAELTAQGEKAAAATNAARWLNAEAGSAQAATEAQQLKVAAATKVARLLDLYAVAIREATAVTQGLPASRGRSDASGPAFTPTTTLPSRPTVRDASASSLDRAVQREIELVQRKIAVLEAQLGVERSNLSAAEGLNSLKRREAELSGQAQAQQNATRNESRRAAAESIAAANGTAAAAQAGFVNQTQINIAKAREKLAATVASRDSQELIKLTAAEIVAKKELNNALRKEVKAQTARSDLPLLQRLGFTGTSGRGSGGGGLGDTGTLGNFAGTIGSLVRFGAGSALLFGLTAGLKEALTEAQTLQIEFTKIEAALDGIGQGSELPDVKQQVLDLARETGTSSTEVANLAFQFIGAFGDAPTAIRETEFALKAVKVTGLSLKETVDAFTALTQSYRDQAVSIEDVNDKALGLETRFGVLAKETVSFAADLAPVAEQAGFTIDQLEALGAVAQKYSGKSGATLAESFGRILPSVQKNALEYVGIFRQIGEENDKFAGIDKRVAESLGGGDIQAFVATLAEVWDDLTRSQQNNIIELAGGRREAQALVGVLSNGKELLGEWNGEMDDSGRTMARFEQLQGTLSQKLAVLGETLKQIGINVFNSGLGQFLTFLASAATGAATALNALFGGLPGQLLAAGVGVAALSKLLGVLAVSYERVAQSKFLAESSSRSSALVGGLKDRVVGAGADVASAFRNPAAYKAATEAAVSTAAAEAASARAVAIRAQIAAIEADTAVTGSAAATRSKQVLALEADAATNEADAIAAGAAAKAHTEAAAAAELNAAGNSTGLFSRTITGIRTAINKIPVGLALAGAVLAVGQLVSTINDIRSKAATESGDLYKAETGKSREEQRRDIEILRQQDRGYSTFDRVAAGVSGYDTAGDIANRLEARLNAPANLSGAQVALDFINSQSSEDLKGTGLNVAKPVRKDIQDAINRLKENPEDQDAQDTVDNFLKTVQEADQNYYDNVIQPAIDKANAQADSSDESKQQFSDQANNVANAAATIQEATDKFKSGDTNVGEYIAALESINRDAQSLIAAGLSDAETLKRAAEVQKQTKQAISDAVRGGTKERIETGEAFGNISPQGRVDLLTADLKSGNLTPTDALATAKEIVQAYKQVKDARIAAARTATEALAIEREQIDVDPAVAAEIIKTELTQYNVAFSKFANNIKGNGIGDITAEVARVIAETGKTVADATRAVIEDRIRAIDELIDALPDTDERNGASGGVRYQQLKKARAALEGVIAGLDRGELDNIAQPGKVGGTGFSAEEDAKAQAALDKEIRDSKRELAIAQAGGNKLLVAQLQRQAAQQDYAEAAATGSIPEMNRARAAIIAADTAARQASDEVAKAKLGLLIALAGKDSGLVAQLQKQQALIDLATARSTGDAAGVANAQAAIVAADRAAAEYETQKHKARLDLIKAQVGSDALTLAQIDQQQADIDYKAAVAANDIVGQFNAQAARVQADRAVRDAIFAMQDAQLGFLLAQANAMDDTVEAAKIANEQAKIALARAENSGDKVAIQQAKNNLIATEDQIHDAQLAAAIEGQQFLFDMGQITRQQFIAYLQGLLAMKGNSEKDIQSIQRQIKQLQGELSQDLQFNLPTVLGLPTLYEARRLNQIATPGAPGNGGAGGIGYQDNRIITVDVTVGNGMSVAEAKTIITDALGVTNRISPTGRTI